MKKLVVMLFLLLNLTAVPAQEPSGRMDRPVAIDAALKQWLVDQPGGVADQKHGRDFRIPKAQ